MKNYEGAEIICYLPLDTPINAIRFLRLVRPVKAFFIKYEFWYNYLHILRHRGIPVYSVSSIFRPSQVFFRWYGHEYAHVLRCVTHFFVQNEESQRLLEGIGLRNATVVGDTRFDRVLQIKSAARQLPIAEAFSKGHKVFVAGSSWPPDEEVFIKYFTSHPDPQISQLAISLAFDRHQLGGRFLYDYDEKDPEKRHEKLIERLRPRVLHLIMDYRMDIVETRLKEIQKQLRQVGNNMEQMMQLLKEHKETKELRDLLAKRLGNELIV